MITERMFSDAQFETLLFSKKDAAGRALYFPFGYWGPGYVVATDAEKQRIVRNYVRTSDAALIAVVAVAIAMTALGLPALAIFPLVLLLPLAFPLSARRAVRGLQKSDVRFTYRDGSRTSAKVFEWPVLIFIELFALANFLGSATMLSGRWSWAVFAFALLMGAVAAIMAYQMVLKWRMRGTAPAPAPAPVTPHPPTNVKMIVAVPAAVTALVCAAGWIVAVMGVPADKAQFWAWWFILGGLGAAYAAPLPRRWSLSARLAIHMVLYMLCMTAMVAFLFGVVFE